MRIIPCEAPKFPKVKMLVDNIISPKLQEHEAIECCFSKSNTTLVCGGMGSGKSTFIIQMLKTVYRKVFEEIILICPENSFNSVDKRDNPFLKIPKENIYHKFDVDVLSEVYARIEEHSADGYHTLLVVDDFGGDLKIKANVYILQQMFLKQRHLRLSTFVLIQNFYQCPKAIREITGNLVLFNTSKSQNNKIFNELFDLKQDQFQQLMKMVPTKHDYLLLNLSYKRIFVDFNEVKFDDE